MLLSRKYGSIIFHSFKTRTFVFVNVLSSSYYIVVVGSIEYNITYWAFTYLPSQIFKLNKHLSSLTGPSRVSCNSSLSCNYGIYFNRSTGFIRRKYSRRLTCASNLEISFISNRHVLIFSLKIYILFII